MTQVAFKYQLKGDAVSNSHQCALFNCFFHLFCNPLSTYCSGTSYNSIVL